MTTSLLEVREYIRNFYVKYEEYIVPVLKFVLALISLLMINEQLGYMSQLNNMAAVLWWLWYAPSCLRTLSFLWGQVL